MITMSRKDTAIYLTCSSLVTFLTQFCFQNMFWILHHPYFVRFNSNQALNHEDTQLVISLILTINPLPLPLTLNATRRFSLQLDDSICNRRKMQKCKNATRRLQQTATRRFSLRSVSSLK